MARSRSDSTDADEAERPLSVAELTTQLKETLENAFPSVWVAGEISNFSRPQSGHCYLTLKDAEAQIRAVIWRGTAVRIPFDLHDGLEVICEGSIDLYAPRGSYQLVIRRLQPQGMGALELALRRLRDKLAAEGLFDPEHKRPLPGFPRRIGIVTSPTGAALRDFLEVLKRRWRGANVLVLPARVQGDGAAQEIATAIQVAQQLPIDVLVVGRGGGSLEDLWAFNEEPVVRAVAASRIPVVSAVGHEIDVTLCDLAADVRALTPSEAAELVVPSLDDMRAALLQTRGRLVRTLQQQAVAARRQVEWFAAHRAFRRPFERMHDLARRLDELGDRSERALHRRVERARAEVEKRAAKLDSLSPLAVLGRGYSLTQRAADGQLIRHAGQLNVGDEIVTRFAAGEARSRVESVDPA